MRIKVCIAAVLLTSFVLPAKAGPIEDCQEYAKLGVPTQNGTLLCRTGYLLDHDPIRKTPYWVAEHLTREKASTKLKRQGSFKADPGLKKGLRAETADYKRSGYDQGHMAPSADMTWSLTAMKESFYLSNMAPQQGVGMNRGIWKVLEENVRNWAIDRGDLYIYTGPAYIISEEHMRKIGKNKVAVPTHVYKIIYDSNQQEAIAFLMPNIKLNTKDMQQFIVSIRTIENETGLDFMSELEPSLQQSIEVNRAAAMW